MKSHYNLIIMRTISPASLEELCINFICANLEDFCYENITDICGFSFESLCFKCPLLLHEQLTENIINILSYSGKLTTRTASLFIDPKTCRIRKFYLRKCQVDARILKLLFSVHRIVKLDLSGATTMSSSLLFELLNEMSSTVRELNLSNTPFYILDFSTVQSLKCLTHLDISNTPADDKAMFTASQYLDCLECINISNTVISETSSFGNLRGQLKVLLAYDTPLSGKNPVEFRNFGSLQKLDISRDLENVSWPSDAINLQEMFTDQEMMPDLVYLDVSGFLDVKECDKSLQSFLSYHPKLQFLGLFRTELSSHAVMKSMSSCIKVGQLSTQDLTVRARKSALHKLNNIKLINFSFLVYISKICRHFYQSERVPRSQITNLINCIHKNIKISSNKIFVVCNSRL